MVSFSVRGTHNQTERKVVLPQVHKRTEEREKLSEMIVWTDLANTAEFELFI